MYLYRIGDLKWHFQKLIREFVLGFPIKECLFQTMRPVSLLTGHTVPGTQARVQLLDQD